MTRTARERVARLADGRRRDGRVREPGRCRSERPEADGDGRAIGRRGVGHGVDRSPTGSLGIGCRSLPCDPGAAIRRTNLHLPDHPSETERASCCPGRADARCRPACAGPAVRHDHVSHAALFGPRPDPDRTDHRRRTTGTDIRRIRPLPGSDVNGGRPWTPFVGPTSGPSWPRWSRRSPSGSGSDVSPHASATGDAAAPNPSGATEFGLIKEAWDTLHKEYVARDRARRPRPRLRRHRRSDRGRRRHRPHLVPDPRGARRTRSRPVGVVRRHRRPDRPRRGRSSDRRRRLRRQPGRRRPGSRPATSSRSVDGKTTTGQEIDEVVGWVRGEAGHDGHGRRAQRRRRRAADLHDHPGRRAGHLGHVDPRARQPDRPPPARLVLERLGRRGRRRAQGHQEGRRGPARPRPARQPGRLRQRGRRHRQPVPRERATSTSSGTPTATRPATRSRPTASPTTCRSSSSSTPARPARRRSSPARSRTPGGRPIDGVQTFGTGTVLGEFPLSDGSALRIGTVEWLTPERPRIWHEGITPDVAVERAADVALLTPEQVGALTPAGVDAIKDPQLARALHAGRPEGLIRRVRPPRPRHSRRSSPAASSPGHRSRASRPRPPRPAGSAWPTRSARAVGLVARKTCWSNPTMIPPMVWPIGRLLRFLAIRPPGSRAAPRGRTRSARPRAGGLLARP